MEDVDVGDPPPIGEGTCDQFGIGRTFPTKLLLIEVPTGNWRRTVSRLGDGGSISSLSCRRRKGGVEKKPPIVDLEGPQSKEDWAVVAADVEADVSEV